MDKRKSPEQSTSGGRKKSPKRDLHQVPITHTGYVLTEQHHLKEALDKDLQRWHGPNSKIGLMQFKIDRIKAPFLVRQDVGMKMVNEDKILYDESGIYPRGCSSCGEILTAMWRLQADMYLKCPLNHYTGGGGGCDCIFELPSKMWSGMFLNEAKEVSVGELPTERDLWRHQMDFALMKNGGVDKDAKRIFGRRLRFHLVNNFDTHQEVVKELPLLNYYVEKARNRYKDAKSSYFVQQCKKFSNLALPTLQEPGKGLEGGTLDEAKIDINVGWVGWLKDSIKLYKQKGMDCKGVEAFEHILKKYHIKPEAISFDCAMCSVTTILPQDGNMTIPASSRIEICINGHYMCRGCLQESEDRLGWTRCLTQWNNAPQGSEHIMKRWCPYCKNENAYNEADHPPVTGSESLGILKRSMEGLSDSIQEERRCVVQHFYKMKQKGDVWYKAKINLAKFRAGILGEIFENDEHLGDPNWKEELEDPVWKEVRHDLKWAYKIKPIWSKLMKDSKVKHVLKQNKVAHDELWEKMNTARREHMAGVFGMEKVVEKIQLIARHARSVMKKRLKTIIESFVGTMNDDQTSALNEAHDSLATVNRVDGETLRLSKFLERLDRPYGALEKRETVDLLGKVEAELDWEQERWSMIGYWEQQRIEWEQGRNATEVIEINDDDD